MRGTFLVREMEEGDLDSVTRIEKETFPSPWSYRAFKAEIDNPFSHTWVVEFEGKIIAYAIAFDYDESFHLANIAVTKEYRRKGIGSLLMKEVEKKAKELGKRIIILEVRESNRTAQAFYMRHGYRLISIRKGYYPPKGEDALVFGKRI